MFWWNKVSGGCRQPLRQFNKIALGQLHLQSYMPACTFHATPSSPQLKVHPVPGVQKNQIWTWESTIQVYLLFTLSPYSFWSQVSSPTGLKFLLLLSVLWWVRLSSLCKLLDGRDWLGGKLGLALVGRALLRKAFIQFSANSGAVLPPHRLACDCSVLESAFSMVVIGSMVGLMVTSSKETYANMLCLPGLLLPFSAPVHGHTPVHGARRSQTRFSNWTSSVAPGKGWREDSEALS